MGSMGLSSLKVGGQRPGGAYPGRPELETSRAVSNDDSGHGCPNRSDWPASRDLHPR